MSSPPHMVDYLLATMLAALRGTMLEFIIELRLFFMLVYGKKQLENSVLTCVSF